MRPGALPLSQVLMLDALVPPIGALVWRLMAGGWALGVQAGDVSKETKRRQSLEFWVLMGLAYIVMFAITIYAYLT